MCVKSRANYHLYEYKLRRIYDKMLQATFLATDVAFGAVPQSKRTILWLGNILNC